MGGFNLWCCFCGGFFDEVREGWLEEVRNWEVPEEGRLSFTPPPAPTEDIVTISDADGVFWSDLVCVGPSWPNYVSSPGMIADDYGTIHFTVSSAEEDEDEEEEQPHLTIHPQCLSFLCRRINASPEQLWGSLYSPGCDYLEYRQGLSGLLEELEYYDIKPFQDQYYHYCVGKSTPRKDGGEKNDNWWDPESMKELQWLLARPTVFPIVPPLLDSTSVTFSTTSPLTSQSPCMDIFNVPELFDTILDCIIGQDISETQLANELQSDNTFTPLSVIQSTKTIFALLQVSKSLYTIILRDRQAIFLRLAWMHGWMLPFTPQDWNNWPNGTFHNGTIFKVDETQDWRAYLLKFLRKEDVHVRNRWRFHKMAVQFAKGRSEVMEGREYRWRFDVGELGFRPDTKPPQPWFWEEEEEIEEVEDEDGDEDGEEDEEEEKDEDEEDGEEG